MAKQCTCFKEIESVNDIVNFFFKVLIQGVVWTLVFSLPAGGGQNAFQKCQSLLLNNPVAEAILELVPDIPALKLPDTKFLDEEQLESFD
ncbi:MAG: hypothetical protein OXC40_04840 [Proteobacteria bacterium]|nr:hypothetical protein [Pseudomonadota bacterium]